VRLRKLIIIIIVQLIKEPISLIFSFISQQDRYYLVVIVAKYLNKNSIMIAQIVSIISEIFLILAFIDFLSA